MQGIQKTQVQSCVWGRLILRVRKTPWGRAWQPTPALLPGEPHEQRSLAGYSPWGHKESTQLSMHACLNCIWPQVTQTVESESGYRRDHRIRSYEVDSQMGRMLTSQRMCLETWKIRKESGWPWQVRRENKGLEWSWGLAVWGDPVGKPSVFAASTARGLHHSPGHQAEGSGQAETLRLNGYHISLGGQTRTLLFPRLRTRPLTFVALKWT